MPSMPGTRIAGDSKYGDEDFTREIRELGGKRLFLHAYALLRRCPIGGRLELGGAGGRHVGRPWSV